MATGFTDFGEETLDAVPDGWVAYDRQNLDAQGGVLVKELADSLSGQALVHVGTGTRAVGAVVNENIEQFADGEIVGLMRFIDPFTGTSFNSPWWVICGRLEGTADGDGAGADTADGIGFGQCRDDEDMLGVKEGTTFHVVGEGPLAGLGLNKPGTDGTPHGQTDGDRFWCRLNFEGTTLKVSVWGADEDEPENFMDTHDVAPNAPKETAGYVGVAINAGQNSGDTFALEALGWSDDPAVPAPMSAGGGGGGGSENPRPLTAGFLKDAISSFLQAWT